ncbi:MAG: hypothetical protein KDC57_17180 [Saprospiraceae bacterium]|nr:hypothetical protein [Saprospiraceae bacterium]
MELKNEKSKHLRVQEWLEQLQYQSWQLELLISGFSIALLLRLYEPLSKFLDNVLLYAPINPVINLFFSYLSLFGTTAWFFLTFNLILLVILRGLWIGTIGLRTLSSSIELEKLNYNSSFQKVLQRKMPTYDRYAEQLDQICSIIFAFTFLTILILASFGVVLMVFMSVKELIRMVTGMIGLPSWYNPLRIVWVSVFGVGGFFYALDFFTLGWIKKQTKLFKFYFPFYSFFGKISFARIYRPLYYNLIGNKAGRRVARSIIPYFLGIYLVTNVDLFQQRYFSYHLEGSFMASQYYEDEREPGSRVVSASIPSRIVKDRLLQLFIRYEPKTDDLFIEDHCPELKELRVPLIPVWSVGDSRSTAFRKLECLSSGIQLRINDSLVRGDGYRFYVHPQTGEPGVLTVLDLMDFPRGNYRLSIGKLKQGEQAGTDTLITSLCAEIPFWVP